MTNLFGTDGIRGTVGHWPLIPEFFLELGIQAGSILKNNNDRGSIAVGRDTRASSEMLQSAFTAGMLSSGMDVIDAGVIPTSGIAWIVKNQKFDAGAVISASHNPLEQNGIKFFDSNGFKLPDDVEIKIEQFVKANPPKTNERPVEKNKFGRSIQGIGLQELYIHSLLSEHPHQFLRGFRITVDCANGAASVIAPEVLTKAGAQVHVVNASPTGQNINLNCGSEYVRRYPQNLTEWINQSNSDFGIALDGDADRVIFVDENGRVIDGDYIIGMLASYFNDCGRLLSNSVVTTTMRNNGLKHYLDSKLINLYETPVGDKFVVEKLKNINLLQNVTGSYGLGGEQSGHVVILNDEFTSGDGIRTALYTIRALLESRTRNITEFAQIIEKTPQIIASAFVGSGKRFSGMELNEMEQSLLDNDLAITRVNYRYSGTEPIFRVMLEANHDYTVADLANIAVNICQKAQLMSGTSGGELDILDCCNGGYVTV